MAQRYADELRDEADIIVGFEEYGGLPRALAEPAPGPAGRVLVGGATVPFRDESRRGLRPRVSFCSIPGFRGRFRSKPMPFSQRRRRSPRVAPST